MGCAPESYVRKRLPRWELPPTDRGTLSEPPNLTIPPEHLPSMLTSLPQGTRVSRMKKLHLNAENSGVQLLRSTYSGTLEYTHSKFANRTAAVTRNTHRTPKAAATAPPESGPIELPRNIAEAVIP